MLYSKTKDPSNQNKIMKINQHTRVPNTHTQTHTHTLTHTRTPTCTRARMTH